MLGQLILQRERGIGSGFPPSPSTSHDVYSQNQQTHARGFSDKRWRQYFVQELLCFDKCFLRREDANDALQINQRFRILDCLEGPGRRAAGRRLTRDDGDRGR